MLVTQNSASASSNSLALKEGYSTGSTCLILGARIWIGALFNFIVNSLIESINSASWILLRLTLSF